MCRCCSGLRATVRQCYVVGRQSVTDVLALAVGMATRGAALRHRPTQRTPAAEQPGCSTEETASIADDAVSPAERIWFWFLNQ
jgi:hypothetical protein